MENIETNFSDTQTEVERKAALGLRTNLGFKIILSGAIILLISGLIALFAPLTDDAFHVIMYGLTSVGSCMIMYGLYLVLG